MHSDFWDRPIAIDLFTGLHGWAEGLVAEGWSVIGIDLNDMAAALRQPKPDYFQLILQDIRTLHGSQFRNAGLIVCSPPCQFFSYTAMPWSRAKALAAEVCADPERLAKETALFDACFRIQREAIEAAGHFIPLVVENVRGAQKWVGLAAWHFGSYYLWGDVPALMPMINRRSSYRKCPNESWNPYRPTGHLTNPDENGVKQGGDWFAEARKGVAGGTSASFGSKSNARKAASAAIAKIPFELARHIAKAWKPREALLEEQGERSASTSGVRHVHPAKAGS